MMSRSSRIRRHFATSLAWLGMAIAPLAARADEPAPKRDVARPDTRATPGLGLQLNDPGAFQGYTLVAPLNSTKTSLIDMEARVVHTWESQYTAGQDAYLLENGHLLRSATLNDSERHFSTAGQGGRVQEFDWDGNLVWDFKFHDDTRVAHHAICRLPNGNVLLIVWEIKTADEAIAAGRRPDKAPQAWLADSVVEIKPTGKTGGDIVWEWHAWDHLIQNAEASKANFGDVAANPQLIDINFGDSDFGLPGGLMRGGPPRPSSRDAAPGTSKERDERNASVERLKGIGYVGNASARGNRGFVPDWTHVNSVAYNAELDQIVISVTRLRRVLDHRPWHDDR